MRFHYQYRVEKDHPRRDLRAWTYAGALRKLWFTKGDGAIEKVLVKGRRPCPPAGKRALTPRERERMADLMARGQ